MEHRELSALARGKSTKEEEVAVRKPSLFTIYSNRSFLRSGFFIISFTRFVSYAESVCNVVDVPILNSIEIGNTSKTSFCFLCCEHLSFEDLPLLQQLHIGEGCFSFVQTVLYQSMIFWIVIMYTSYSHSRFTLSK